MHFHTIRPMISMINSNALSHGFTKPNDTRFPNQPEKNRRVELSLVLDMSKENLAQYK